MNKKELAILRVLNGAQYPVAAWKLVEEARLYNIFESIFCIGRDKTLYVMKLCYRLILLELVWFGGSYSTPDISITEKGKEALARETGRDYW